jgi:hypothetical protein
MNEQQRIDHLHGLSHLPDEPCPICHPEPPHTPIRYDDETSRKLWIETADGGRRIDPMDVVTPENGTEQR